MEDTKVNITKRSAILVAILCAVTFGAIFLGGNNCYASTTYSDEHVKAVVNDDGVSGTLYFNDDTLYRTYERDSDWLSPTLSSVNGHSLKDIIKFKNGGYVSEVFTYFYIFGALSQTNCRAVAKGPSGLCNLGHLKFYDSEGESYSLSIWSSLEYMHQVTIWNGSKMAKVTKMEWY